MSQTLVSLVIVAVVVVVIIVVIVVSERFFKAVIKINPTSGRRELPRARRAVVCWQ